MQYELLNFKVMGDDRGSLIALENQKNIPFDIKRVYYIYDTKQGVERGFHAHKNLRQVAIAMSGKCTFVMDNGIHREEIILDNPTQGLLIDGLIWREMKDFSDGCVLVVFASELYDEADYIRNYDEFIDIINTK